MAFRPVLVATPAVSGNYGQAIVPLPSDIMLTPNEGQLTIALNIDWSGTNGDVVSGATKIDLNNRQLRGFSSIRGVYVDNSMSGADVTLIFPQTQFQFTVPAGTGGVFPVVSLPGSLEFYVVALNAIAGDKTFLQALNYLPYPVDLSRPTFQTVAGFTALGLTGAGSQQLIPLGVNGTIQNMSVLLEGAVAGAGAGSASITVQDGEGSPVVFEIIAVLLGNAQVVGPTLLFNQSGLSQRFVNGVVINVTVAGTAFAQGAIAANCSYRVP